LNSGVLGREAEGGWRSHWWGWGWTRRWGHWCKDCRRIWGEYSEDRLRIRAS